MSNRIENRIVLGSLRYKSASNTNLLLQVPLVQHTKENIEFDRTLDINLEELYDRERQECSIFRPSAKLSLLFSNQYSGFTTYYPFQSALYYENVLSLINASCSDPALLTSYSGFPQFFEFDFMRNDNYISGYTTYDDSLVVHKKFVNQSATTYNWSIYLSYAYENDPNKQMQVVDSTSNNTINWTASDGIPFTVERTNVQGQSLISFRCLMPHGLSVGEYVKLSINYDGLEIFQVQSLGDPFFDTEENIFNIYDVGYTGSTFSNGVTGTFKRIIDITNSADTISTYYVRKHKILTVEDNAVLTKSGFEQQIFKKDSKLDKSGYTANKQTRISVKNGNSVYTLSYNKDIDIKPLRDNHYRPLSELFFTIVWKGYMGWTFGITNPIGGFYGLKQGWEFNIQPQNQVTFSPNTWWTNPNTNSDTNIPLTSYTTPTTPYPFTYVTPLGEGDILDGDYCEWNNYEMIERVISDMYHKFKFNPFQFNTTLTPQSDPFGPNPKGYYYKPHYGLQIRAFSDYIETAPPEGVVGVPSYSYFSTTNNQFLWRDLYSYGYIDPDNIGVNFPYLNNAHYPYREIIFRLIGEGGNYNNINNTAVADPTIDNCE
jgi:hypothetical protein